MRFQQKGTVKLCGDSLLYRQTDNSTAAMNGKAMRSVDSISESEEINDHPDNHTMDSSSDGRSLLSMASFDNCSILSMELNEVRMRSVVNKIDRIVSRPASDS